MQILCVISVIRSGISLLQLPTADSLGILGNELEDLLRQARTQLLWQIGVSSVIALFCCMLVAGVSRQSPCLVMTFLIFFGLYLTLATGTLLYSFFDPTAVVSEYQMEDLTKEHGEDTARFIINISLGMALALTVFFWYLWLVVFSFYREMTGGGEQPMAPPGTWNAKQDAHHLPPMI